MNRSSLLCAALAGGLVLGLSGCVSQDAPSNSGGGATASNNPACAQSPGVTKDGIKLGVLSDLSGPVSAGGIPWSKGAQAFFDYANADLNGVNGRPVSLTIADHAYNPQTALQRYKELEPDVLGLPLSFGSAANNAVSGQLVDDCMTMVANNGPISDIKPNVFYNASVYEHMTLNGIDWYLSQGNPAPKVALFYQGDAFGEAAKTALEFAAKKRGFQLVSAQSYAVTDQTYTGQLSAITNADPDVVVMASTVGATFGFFGAAEAAGATWDWLGLQPTFAPAVLKLPIAAAYTEKFRIIFGLPTFAASGQGTQTAATQLAAVSPALANDPSALGGWQAALIMYQALLKADKAKGGLTRGSLLESMRSLSFDSDGLGPKTYTFDPDSPTAGAPYTDSLVLTVDPTVPGYLKTVQDYTTSDLVAAFDANL